MTTAPVHPERTLRELNQLWRDMAHDPEAPDPQAMDRQGAVLRACSMTLIVAAEDEADADRARATVALLMRDHPSRAIIVRPGKDSDLDARVFAECWRPFGRTQQVCSEGIEVITGAMGYGEAALFIVPLRVPDLPVVLWCRGAKALETGVHHPLYRLAGKVIFDSRQAPDCDDAIRALRRLHAYGYRVADLHWARLTGWRELLASLFQNGGLRAAHIHSAEVGYGGKAIATCARYFEAWLRVSLKPAPIGARLVEGPPGLRSVTLTTSAGDLTIARDDGHFTVSGLGHNYRSAIPPMSEDALMREELSILGPDAVYEQVLNA